MAFFLDRGLVVKRVSFVWRAASAGGLRDDTAAGNVASLTFARKCLLHGASDCGCGNGFLFSRRPRPVSQSFQSACSVIFMGWWLSFEPNFEAQLAVEVPQRAFRPSFSDPSHSRDRRFDLAGSAFDFDRLSAADRCRSFASVRELTSEARIRREKQKFGRSACKRSV